MEIRRATIEDLPALRALWRKADLLVPEVEKHLTEFQVALSTDGCLVGCAGLQISQKHGKIHHVIYAEPGLEEELRRVFFERLKTLSRNYGLVRLWTREPALFWRSSGFQPATDNALRDFPPPFGSPREDWLTLPLASEHHVAAVEQELELFKMAQVHLTEKTLRQVKRVKIIAWIVLVISLGFLLFLGIYYVRRLPSQKRQPSLPVALWAKGQTAFERPVVRVRDSIFNGHGS